MMKKTLASNGDRMRTFMSKRRALYPLTALDRTAQKPDMSLRVYAPAFGC
jgi:hypothetical protein